MQQIMHPRERLHFGKKSLGLWLHTTNRQGSLIRAFTHDQKPIAFNHYPPQDYVSKNRQIQYFYHSHRNNGEHGHIHIYLKDSPSAKPLHFIAIGLSNRGLPISLFTVSSSSIHERLPRLTEITSLAKILHETHSQEEAIGLWITSFCLFYQDAIQTLIEQKHFKEADPSSGLEITSLKIINWSDDLDQAEADADCISTQD